MATTQKGGSKFEPRMTGCQKVPTGNKNSEFGLANSEECEITGKEKRQNSQKKTQVFSNPSKEKQTVKESGPYENQRKKNMT